MVTTTARPPSEMDGNFCGRAAAMIASTTVCRLPFIGFLKPTGADSADAIWRCNGLSDVRAPMAPHVSSSA